MTVITLGFRGLAAHMCWCPMPIMLPGDTALEPQTQPREWQLRNRFMGGPDILDSAIAISINSRNKLIHINFPLQMYQYSKFSP